MSNDTFGNKNNGQNQVQIRYQMPGDNDMRSPIEKELDAAISELNTQAKEGKATASIISRVTNASTAANEMGLLSDQDMLLKLGFAAEANTSELSTTESQIANQAKKIAKSSIELKVLCMKINEGEALTTAAEAGHFFSHTTTIIKTARQNKEELSAQDFSQRAGIEKFFYAIKEELKKEAKPATEEMTVEELLGKIKTLPHAQKLFENNIPYLFNPPKPENYTVAKSSSPPRPEGLN